MLTDAPSPPPLLAADDLRVDVGGAPACDGLTLRTSGERVLILGAPRALFEAATGQVPVVRGALSVLGLAAPAAASRGLTAGAAQDPPTPPRWTVAEYVEWSARLSGLRRADARASARAAIDKLALGPFASTRTSFLVPHARRATIVAGALATRAEVLLLEDPLGGLPDEASAAYATILAGALDAVRWVIFAPRVPLGLALGSAADEAIVAGRARVEAQGRPADVATAERRFVARIDGDAAALAGPLAARGASVAADGGRLVVDLGADLSTSELMAICDRAGVAVVELMPASRALS